MDDLWKSIEVFKLVGVLAEKKERGRDVINVKYANPWLSLQSRYSNTKYVYCILYTVLRVTRQFNVEQKIGSKKNVT